MFNWFTYIILFSFVLLLALCSADSIDVAELERIFRSSVFFFIFHTSIAYQPKFVQESISDGPVSTDLRLRWTEHGLRSTVESAAAWLTPGRGRRCERIFADALRMF